MKYPFIFADANCIISMDEAVVNAINEMKFWALSMQTGIIAVFGWSRDATQTGILPL